MTMFDFLLEESINNHTDKQKKNMLNCTPYAINYQITGNEFKYN